MTSGGASVFRAIAERLPASIELAFFGLVAAMVVGVVLGSAQARFSRSFVGGIVASIVLLCRTLPVVLLVLFFQSGALFSGALPVAGISSLNAFDVRDRLAHATLPVLSLAIPLGAWASLFFAGHFRAARSDRNAMRGLLQPVALTLAFIGPAILTGCLLIEPRFAWPGAARLFWNHLGNGALISGLLLVYCATVVLLKVPGNAFGGATPSQSPLQRQARSPRAAPFLVLAGVLIAFAAMANVLAPAGPYVVDNAHWNGFPLSPGTAGHLLGTDENGRDMLARLLFGLRTSLEIALGAAVIATAIAALLARSVPRIANRTALQVTGIRPFGAVPLIVAALAFLILHARVPGVLSPVGIALLIGVASSPSLVPAFGAFDRPALGAVIDIAACGLVLEVMLSNVGLGVQPPIASLGNMFAFTSGSLEIAPWVPLSSFAAVVITLFALYGLADALKSDEGPILRRY